MSKFNFTNTIKACFIICLVAFILACSKDDVGQKQEESAITDAFNTNLLFSKKIKVYDSQAKNFVILKFNATDEVALNKHLKDWEYTLNLVYKNEQTASQAPKVMDQTEQTCDNVADVETEVDSVNIDNKAIGFAVNVRLISKLKDSYGYDRYFKSPKWWHHAMVNWVDQGQSNQGVRVDFYTAYSSTASWKWKQSALLSESVPSTGPFYYSNYRIMIRLQSNWKNYSVFFRHWDEDEWQEDGTDDGKW